MVSGPKRAISAWLQDFNRSHGSMKTTYLLLLTITLIFAAAVDLSAGIAEGETAARSLSLSEVTSVVLANNPGIKEALNKWNAARARIPQAAAWDDPRLGGEQLVHSFCHGPPKA